MSFDKKGCITQQFSLIGLNPFRTGRCLSTVKTEEREFLIGVSIPFEQGDVFRRIIMALTLRDLSVSIPFEQGDVFRL